MLKIQAIGNLGKDAEIKEVNTQFVISFSVAINNRSKDASGTIINTTTWLNCDFWKRDRNSTTVAQYLKKGTSVYIEGYPKVRTYTTASGEHRADLTVRIDNLEFVGGRKDDDNQGGTQQTTDQNQNAQNYNQPQNNNGDSQGQGVSYNNSDSTDDLPF